MNKANYLFFILFIVVTSCEKNEIPIQLSGCTDELASNYDQYANISDNSTCNYESFTKIIPLTSDYRYQIYYEINSNSIVNENLKTDWDIAFENNLDGYHIIINSSTFSQISRVDNVPFENIINVSGLIWNWDNPNGDLNNTAIGDYRELNNTFWIIDLGYSPSGNQRGYKKFMIESVSQDYYTIRHANLDNTEDITVIIYKNYETNFIYYSLKQKLEVEIEPLNNSWDLLFTQYTHIFDSGTPYLVTGTLINNHSNIEVAIDSITNFNEINDTYISTYEFIKDQNTIGYNWKEYFHDTQTFSIKSHINYIIKKDNNTFFKLRFIDYYNNLGEKGFPKIEIQKL